MSGHPPVDIAEITLSRAIDHDDLKLVLFPRVFFCQIKDPNHIAMTGGAIRIPEIQQHPFPQNRFQFEIIGQSTDFGKRQFRWKSIGKSRPLDWFDGQVSEIRSDSSPSLISKGMYSDICQLVPALY